MRLSKLLTGLLALLLVACQTRPATLTPTPPAIPTLAPSRTATVLPTPSVTLTQSPTASPTFIPSPTQTTAPTAASTSIPLALVRSGALGKGEMDWLMRSPDGKIILKAEPYQVRLYNAATEKEMG
jgi:hypothetical protein